MQLGSSSRSALERDFAATLLVVDDEQSQHDCVELICQSHFSSGELRILHVSSISQAMDLISETSVQVILLDKDFGGSKETGIDAVPRLLKIRPHLQILMLTGSKDIHDVVTAISHGALNYVTKETQRALLPTQIEQAIRLSKISLAKARMEGGADASDSGDSTDCRKIQTLQKNDE